MGAALILPAIVAVVASNFSGRSGRERIGWSRRRARSRSRPAPLIGGLFTTYLWWRWVFVGEVLIVFGILALTGRMADATPEAGVRLDLVGPGLSALGLSAIQTGVGLLPLPITLLRAAAGIPKAFPHVSPRGVVPLGFLALLAGLVVMVGRLTRAPDQGS